MGMNLGRQMRFGAASGLGVAASALVLTLSGSAAAGFEWGGECESGNGAFAQAIAHYNTEDVGEIPAGKRNVRVELYSPVDTDIQLFDQLTGEAIVAWPGGLLKGSTPDEVTYEGVTYRYSGYNGVNGEFGHEYIEVLGDTNRPLVMKAFGYQAGQAQVEYSWEAIPTCNEVGDGTFGQYVPLNRTIAVGTIPAGKTQVLIELTAAQGRDVDIQLVDVVTGTEIIAWPNGILFDDAYQETVYEGMLIRYTGYNGINGNVGHEAIQVAGRVTRDLEMRAYGYAAGTARVDYRWGDGVGQACGTLGAAECADGLLCKWGDDYQLAYADHPGQCHTEDWCESDESAEQDCANVPHVATPGYWSCEEFACSWNTGVYVECGDPRDGYTAIHGPDEVAAHTGEQVQLTWSAVASDLAMCTKMACSEDNPCCNQCSAGVEFDGIRLHASSGIEALGCSGNECSVSESCTYPDESLVTVYGIVSEDGHSLTVDHHCGGAELVCGLYGPDCPAGYGCVDMGCPVVKGNVTQCINPHGVCAPGF